MADELFFTEVKNILITTELQAGRFWLDDAWYPMLSIKSIPAGVEPGTPETQAHYLLSTPDRMREFGQALIEAADYEPEPLT
jgi:hypothetical protein